MFTKQALDSFQPIHLLSMRFLIASVTLSLLALFKVIKLDFKGKPIKELLILTLFQPVFYFTLETIGVNLTSSSQAGMMIALIPVIVTILAVIFLKEIPTKLQTFFIFTSVIGVMFILSMSGNLEIGGHFLGMLCLLGAVFSGATYNILSRKLSTQFKPVEITFVMMWVGAITFNIIAFSQSLLNGTLNTHFSGFSSFTAVMSLFYLSILSSICAFFMLNYMLGKLPAARSGVFANLTTVVSILAGIFIKNELVHWYQLVGGILIIIGVWGTNYFSEKPLSKNINLKY